MQDPQQEALAKLRGLWDEPSYLRQIASPKVEVVPMPGEGEGSTIIPHPPQFQPAPTAVGPELGKAVQQLLKIAPSLQGKIGNVMYGPTADSMDRLRANNDQNRKSYGKGIFVEKGPTFDPQYDLERTNLMGLTNTHSGNITLNPSTRTDQEGFGVLPTLAHEVTHAAGYGDETTPDTARQAMLQLMKLGKQ